MRGRITSHDRLLSVSDVKLRCDRGELFRRSTGEDASCLRNVSCSAAKERIEGIRSMVHTKPAMRLLGGVVLSVALSLHHSTAHGQTAAGNGEPPPPTGSPAASSEAERADAATIVVTGKGM